MLKPKRKISSKEIKRAPFLETIFAVKEHLNSKKQQYLKIGISVLSVLVLSFFINQNSKSNAKEAEFGLSIGMVYLEKGDIQNAMMQFQQIVDEYSSTPSGHSASFYIGKIHFDKSEYDLALSHFERSISRKNNIFLNNAAYSALAEIHANKNQYDEAISFQKKLIDNSSSFLDEAFSMLKLGKFHLLNGDKEIAKSILQNILDENPDNQDIKSEADYLNGLIQTLGVD